MDALHLAGFEFKEATPTRLYITSGELQGAALDLVTGEVTGDSDYGHTAEKFGILRQYYKEALTRQECARTGATISERHIDEEGNVILTLMGQMVG
jgi:hypothetical protein